MAQRKHLGRRGAVVIVVLVALLIAVTARFPFQIVRNSGSAMEPTLRDRQLVILEKLTYRLRPP